MSHPAIVRTLDLRWASEIEARPVAWLWEPWLARGTVAVLDGDPGVGKSSLTVDLIARVTAGRPLPGADVSAPPAVALLVAMEDPLDAVVRPRLAAAGADLGRVALLGGVRETGADGRFESILQLPRDLDLIAAACREHRPALLVIDPLFAVLGADGRGRVVKANDDQGVRRLTNRLKQLAEEVGATVLLLRHLNKAAGGSALHRGSGSIAIAGQARSVLLAARDLDGAGGSVLAMVKTNLVATPRSRRFQVAGTGTSSTVEWLGESDLTADELIRPAALEKGRRRALSAAKEFLEEALADGGETWEKLMKGAAEAGIAEITLRRAREELRLEKIREGRRFVWQLPFRLPPLNDFAR
jgi:hypothetical protein